MADTIGLPHWTIGDAFPTTGDQKVDRELTARWAAIQENFESLVAQTAKQLAGAFEQRVPPGVIEGYGGSTAPTGYLLCDGSAVSRSTYADLFAAIGTAHGGGDGLTTFNLPAYNDGRYVRGAVGAPGATGGNLTHTHTYSDDTGTDSGGSLVQSGASGVFEIRKNHTHFVSGTTDGAFNDPLYRDMVYIIKT